MNGNDVARTYQYLRTVLALELPQTPFEMFMVAFIIGRYARDKSLAPPYVEVLKAGVAAGYNEDDPLGGDDVKSQVAAILKKFQGQP